MAVKPKKRERTETGRFKAKFVFNDEVAHRVFHMAKRGLSLDQIGGFYGLTSTGMLKATKKYPELNRAVIEGRNYGVNFVSKKLWRRIKKGDASMIRFYLSTKGDYNPKQTVAIGSDPNSDKPLSLKLNTTDVQEAAKIYAKFMTEK